MADPHPERPQAGERPGAWLLLFAALAASAGHGLFLAVALSPGGWLADLGRLVQRAGALEAALVIWYLASIPLCALVLALRRPLQRRAWLAPCAALAALVALVAFGLQARTILRSRDTQASAPAPAAEALSAPVPWPVSRAGGTCAGSQSPA